MDIKTLVEAGNQDAGVCGPSIGVLAQTPECKHWQVPSASVSMEGGGEYAAERGGCGPQGGENRENQWEPLRHR